jgi:hypothetical protein
MGFLDQVSNVKEYPLTVLMAGFQAQCQFETVGLVQTFINDEQRGVFTLNDVHLHAVDPGLSAINMALPELHILKEVCHVLAFEEMLSQDETGLMPRAERLAVYTSHYAIQANFHMGADSNISDFIETSRLLFIAATDAQIFPLFAPRSALVQQAPLVYVAQSQVRMHHPV